jgi:hypothetical protein
MQNASGVNLLIGIDSSLLTAYYQSLSGGAGSLGSNPAQNQPASSSIATNGKSKAVLPIAPWESRSQLLRAPDLVKKALDGRSLIDPNGFQSSGTDPKSDYGKLFTLYQGLNGLTGLVDSIQAKNITATEKAKIQTVFNKGQADISAYIDSLKLDAMSLTRGAATSTLRTSAGVHRSNTSYTTSPIHTGTAIESVKAFEGPIVFDVAVKGVNTTKNVHIDLAGMGATTRSINEVTAYINSQLKAQNIATRFEKLSIPAEPKTIQSNGKTVTLPAGSPSWSLKIKGDIGEILTFSTTDKADAVYLTQTAGVTSPVSTLKPAPGITPPKPTFSQQELLKFQTDLTTATAPPDAFRRVGETNYVDDLAYKKVLGPEITAIRASQTTSDGSVYMLADIKAAVGDQTIKGSGDVALIKYDSAGNVIYTRTLGAGDKASGLAMSVSSDGKVAIAGSVTGVLAGSTNGSGLATDGVTTAPASTLTKTPTPTTDSFVTLFDAKGEESWTMRRGVTADDEATAVAFAADGSVYVAGRTKAAFSGNAAVGGWDNYIQGYGSNGAVVPKTVFKFTGQFGSTGDDRPASMIVDGSSLLVGSKENGRAILRRFDIQATGAPTLAATRDLGDLMGGDLTGIALNGGNLVAVGSSSNAALSGATVSRAASGGQDAFAMSLSKDLVASSSDRIAFLGGAGQDRATAMTVSDGKLWLTGTSTAAIDSAALMGTKDGFVSRFDISTGTQEWTRRFTAKEKSSIPSSIAVASGGASVLDRLGLPSGQIAYSDSTLLTSATSVRAGDQFRIRTQEGGPTTTITILPTDTMKSLKERLSSKFGSQAKVTVASALGVDKLSITYASSRSSVELLAGPSGKDALEGLGLAEGQIRSFAYDKTVNQYTYGLKLDRDLKIDTPEAIKLTTEDIQTAMSTIRTAFRAIGTGLNPTEAAAQAAKEAKVQKTQGAVPGYLTKQMANYQAGLNRLTGGG